VLKLARQHDVWHIFARIRVHAYSCGCWHVAGGHDSAGR
jgi:hypothetical protein